MEEIKRDPAVDSLYAFAVWGNLDRVKDYELILLKGYLFIEMILTVVLERKDELDVGDLSFYKKMKEFEKLGFSNHKNWKTIIASLHHLNKIRNKLAHNFLYKTALEDLTKWSTKINDNLIGGKVFEVYRKNKNCSCVFNLIK